MYLLLYLGEFLKQKEIKMLEEKINELGNRYITNGIYEGYRYVKVNIPEDWDVVNFHSMGISAERDINNPTIVVFGSDSTGVSFSSIIDVIFEFIKPHLAIVEKNKLFDILVDKLELIFKENDLETLKTLSFDFSGKQKRGYNKKQNTLEKDTNTDKREFLLENRDLSINNIENLESN